MQTIVFILLSSLFCFGWQYCTYDDGQSREIAWWFRWFVKKYIPKNGHKPLMDCIVCMGGIYSAIIYSAYLWAHQIEITNIIRLKGIFIMICTAGLNRIIKNICER